MKKRVFKILTILLIVGFLVWGLHSLYNSPYFGIKEINVRVENSTLQHLSKDEISEIIVPYSKQSFLKIDLNQLKKEFKTKAWVREVDVKRVWPLTIDIYLAERHPIARWSIGEDQLIDENGELFSATVSDVLVVFQGLEDTEKMMFQLYQQIQPILHNRQIKIKKLIYTNRSSWEIELDNGIILYLGRNNMVKRLEQLMKVWPELLKQDTRKIDAIHLEYREGFAVKYK